MISRFSDIIHFFINIVIIIIIIVIVCLQLPVTDAEFYNCVLPIHILFNWTYMCGTRLVINVESFHYFAVLRNYPLLTMPDQALYFI